MQTCVGLALLAYCKKRTYVGVIRAYHLIWTHNWKQWFSIQWFFLFTDHDLSNRSSCWSTSLLFSKISWNRFLIHARMWKMRINRTLNGKRPLHRIVHKLTFSEPLELDVPLSLTVHSAFVFPHVKLPWRRIYDVAYRIALTNYMIFTTSNERKCSPWIKKIFFCAFTINRFQSLSFAL